MKRTPPSNPIPWRATARRTLAALAAATLAAASPPSVGPVSSEEEGVRSTLQRYFQGHATGDPSHFREAFLPSAHIEGLRDGELTSWTLDQYCSLFPGEPAEDEAVRSRRIDFVEVSGTAAVAGATLDHGAVAFTDYFVLLRVDERWKIANKVYATLRR